MAEPIERASRELIARVWEERWGLPVVSVGRQYLPADVEGLSQIGEDGREEGLVTWAIEGEQAEIVSLDSLRPGRGVGARLLAAAEDELARCGVRRVSIVTTNDNLRALGLYMRHGYRLVRLHLDAMERVRALKPGVAAAGNEGIPLRDMWELEKQL